MACLASSAWRGAFSVAALLGLAPGAGALEIKLPQETATYTPSELPGYRLVQQNCMTCHSAQYVQYQPPSSPRGYWDATVRKMKKPFNAPFAEADIPAVVDYLVRTYGAERGASISKDAPASAQDSAPAASSKAVATAGANDASALLAANGCVACHAVDKKLVGPAFKDVAAKYSGKPDALGQVVQSVRAGGAGKWGEVPMPPFPQLSDAELSTLATWILGL